MWLFLEGGRFLSLAADADDPDYLHIRARLPGDIETDFPEAEILERSGGDDYRFQTRVPRRRVMNALEDELRSLSYQGLKNTVCNRNRVEALTSCAHTMQSAQERARRGDAQEGLCYAKRDDTPDKHG
ncbi:MAG: hypothetical protein HQL53_10985 [Magnetococcales bacterium]|nr:hypothetical protein [Magnetococcales bacterium]